MNSLDFITNIEETKQAELSKMYNSLLGLYNGLTGSSFKFIGWGRNDSHIHKGTNLFILFDKINHMVNNLYSPQSLKQFLSAIVKNGVKDLGKPDEQQPIGKGHFRWDYKAIELNDKEVEAIRLYLGVNRPISKEKRTYNSLQPKPNFEIITDYNEQAEAFLNWTDTELITEYKEHGLYFSEDTAPRDIYTITLKNNRTKYRFNFGQSINNFGKMPTAYDILACLTKYEVDSFEDFCGEFGYELDSRSAFKTYKLVKRDWENVNNLFTSEELELLREIS